MLRPWNTTEHDPIRTFGLHSIEVTILELAGCIWRMSLGSI